MKKYDLTSSSGLQKALKDICKYSFMTSPLGLVKYTLDKVLDSSKQFETQRDVAVELIRRGKEQGVDEMEIVMENKRGFKLNVPVEEAKIDTALGSDDKMHIKVKYK